MESFIHLREGRLPRPELKPNDATDANGGPC